MNPWSMRTKDPRYNEGTGSQKLRGVERNRLMARRPLVGRKAYEEAVNVHTLPIKHPEQSGGRHKTNFTVPGQSSEVWLGSALFSGFKRYTFLILLNLQGQYGLESIYLMSPDSQTHLEGPCDGLRLRKHTYWWSPRL